MFNFFEQLLQPTKIPPGPPPASVESRRSLSRFYWHYARQARGLLAALFVTGLAVAFLDTLIPVFIGRVVTLVSGHDRQTLLHDAFWQLASMAAVLLTVRPLALATQNLVTNQAVAAGMTNLVRWQAHWYIVRQSWSFFQSDLAGRIANRVMQTGPSLRESIVSVLNAVWYIIVYGSSAIIFLASTDFVLAMPILAWFCGYVLLLRFFVPRLRYRSERMSEVRSTLVGRIVDTYTNILIVKLFARARDQDDFVREAVDHQTKTFNDQMRTITSFSVALSVINACMVVGTGGIAVWLWTTGNIALGSVAMALPLAHQVAQMSGWVAQNVTGIFENVGVVQDGMRSIAEPQQLPDAPKATTLQISRGAIRFEHIQFGYGTARGVINDFTLDIAPGEHVGLIGPSGAGKSTLVNLLLRFHDLGSGSISIDGQDIANVTQESLRTQIAMVPQDTSLLHRSIRDNIRYGRPWASETEIIAAARGADALDFISALEDWNGRRGFEAHVGERGVKLSTGQRQRLAIARAILKDAPILVLDEATSALDSEVEAAIQGQLQLLIRGRTVIMIAHRLSTIVGMDRLVVLEHGRIAEQGSHTSLLNANGIYARLWRRQSGSVLATELAHGVELSP